VVATGGVVVLSGCVTGASVASREWEQQLAGAPACSVTVDDTDVSAWREVQSTGFRVCVPSDWRLLRRPGATRDRFGAGGWRTGELALQWRYAPGRISDCGLNLGTRMNEHQWLETIGDSDVCITLNLRSITALWEDGLRMGGSAADGVVVARLLSVIRTVRLLGAAPPP
jgi:hypothetical protein